MKVIGHFLVVDQAFTDTTKTKTALIDIESIETISEAECNGREYRKIFFNGGSPMYVNNSMEEITNILENEYSSEEY